MNKTQKYWYLGLILLAGLAACSRQPEKPLELRLTLARRKIKASEYLWYLAEARNVGRKPVRITDPFWKMQEAAGHPLSRMRLEIIGPHGEKMERLTTPWGFHIEHKFWTSDCGDAKSCKEPIELKGGETLTATPSIIAPIRPRNPHIMDDMGDMRGLPEIPKGMSQEQIAALQKQWKATVEASGYLMGDPTFRPDTKESAVSHPRGYRVLDVYDFDEPGKYRMRMVYFPFPYSSVGTLEKFAKEVGYSLKGYLSSEGWPKETKVFLFESNWIEFEVERAPFPEHLFKHYPSEGPEDRVRREWLKRKLKDASDWSPGLIDGGTQKK